MKLLLTYSLLVFTLISCAQKTEERSILGKSIAETRLKEALAETEAHNFVDYNSIIISDSITAISIAEPILFSIYGKENITKQRPYEIYLIDNYWVISGTLPEERLGGCFLIIINAFDSKIIKITHAK
jgi:hypothetical protein